MQMKVVYRNSSTNYVSACGRVGVSSPCYRDIPSAFWVRMSDKDILKSNGWVYCLQMGRELFITRELLYGRALSRIMHLIQDYVALVTRPEQP
ncbi:hypothetical protein TNCT_732241 [Trichonephila clavata]|uniref:Uncharacterized protein n=1 Tax=Trichonephila clavata TaxID=2740835 RepID=A0A8X6FQD3_TRICU|nr:hypothetical protein TNCT_732241 [Trichonephila clavata]